MVLRYGKVGLATLSLLALGLGALPVTALAQEDPGTTDTSTISNQKVDVTVESADLYYTLKLLFSQIKANFTLDTSLRGISVTASLKKTPFRTALETILKSAPIPLTYRFENNIYSIVPKVEETLTPEGTTDPRDEETPESNKRAQKIFKGSALNYNAMAIVELINPSGVIRAWPAIMQSMSGGRGGMGGMMGGMGGMGGGMGGMGMGGMGMGGGMGGMGMGGGMGGGMMGGFGGGGFGR